MPHAEPSQRLAALHRWVASRHGTDATLKATAGDASFRRYFRLCLGNDESRIIMDAPPDKEDSHSFVTIAEQWRAVDLPVPRVYATNFDAGFFELEDLGDTPLHRRLGADDDSDTRCYESALALLDRLQNDAPGADLPVYDEALLGRELDLFPQWCLDGLLDLAPPPSWPALRRRLIAACLSQPRVVVHRDFDAMNLMCHEDRLWLIDFQDAVQGPLTYDPISLLRGRYRRFSRRRFAAWLEAFRRRAVADGRLPPEVNGEAFLYMADVMAAQRSLKVLGIFCRLTLRDDKAGYLARLPHFLAHLRDSLAPWPAFADFDGWLEEQFTPRLEKALGRRGVPEGSA